MKNVRKVERTAVYGCEDRLINVTYNFYADKIITPTRVIYWTLPFTFLSALIQYNAFCTKDGHLSGALECQPVLRFIPTLIQRFIMLAHSLT